MRQLIVRLLPFLLSTGLLACGGGGDTSTPDSGSDRYVRANQIPLASLNAGTDAGDLAPLAALLAGKRIVQLGESTHGSREMNQVKVRLIQHLHQHLGFDVIAFESSVFGCNLGREREAAIGAAELMASCLFGVWQTEEVKALFDYVIATQKTARPLRLAGFDVQFSAPGFETADRLAAQLAAADAGQAEATAALARRAFAADAEATACYQSQLSTCPAFSTAQIGLRTELLALTARLQAAADPAADPRAALTARSLADLMRMHERHFAGDTRLRWRDEGMASNLGVLANQLFPTSRIIVWAHNSHIATDHPHPHSAEIDDRTMGMFLDLVWGNELYTLGLYMLRGVSADVDRTPLAVTTHAEGSLEAIIAAVGQVPLILPFTAADATGPDDDWLHRPIQTKYWGQFTQVLTPARAYDAVLVIDWSSTPSYLR